MEIKNNRPTFRKLLENKIPFKILAPKKVLIEFQDIAVEMGIMHNTEPSAVGLYYRPTPEVRSGWVNSRGLSYIQKLNLPEYDCKNDSIALGNPNKRVWLNPENSSSTSTMVCYSGEANWSEENSDKPAISRFVEIADCHGKIRIHQARFETMQEYIDKIKLMKETLAEYQAVLEIEKAMGDIKA